MPYRDVDTDFERQCIGRPVLSCLQPFPAPAGAPLSQLRTFRFSYAMALIKITTRWSGFSGAPGYTNFHFNVDSPATQAGAAAALVETFWKAVASRLPSIVRLDILPEAPEFSPGTGQMVDVHAFSAPAVISGTAAGAYSSASGGLIHWFTNEVRNGRRLRGKTFLVPMTASAFGTDGALAVAHRTALEDAATALRSGAAAQLVIWGRPTARGAGDGVLAPVTSARVPQMQAVMRSRRD